MVAQDSVFLRLFNFLKNIYNTNNSVFYSVFCFMMSFTTIKHYKRHYSWCYPRDTTINGSNYIGFYGGQRQYKILKITLFKVAFMVTFICFIGYLATINTLTQQEWWLPVYNDGSYSVLWKYYGIVPSNRDIILFNYRLSFGFVAFFWSLCDCGTNNFAYEYVRIVFKSFQVSPSGENWWVSNPWWYKAYE